MQRTVLYILIFGVGTGLVSMLYFLLLAAGFVPFPAIVAITAVCLIFFVRILQTSLLQWVEDDGRKHAGSLLILAIGILTIGSKAPMYYEKYGAWDAWAIWNLQAKYLSSGELWQGMFLNTQHGHPDYPLLVPAMTSFLHRLTAVRIETASFAFSFLITLLIPTIIFLQLRQKNLLVATYVLYMLATDAFYVQQGVSMYADTALAFFFLSALLFMRQQLYGNKQVLLAAMALGCAIWTKNEGAMLAVVFCFFYFKELFLGGRVKYFALGCALPGLVWLLFKIIYAPGNDLLASLQTDAVNWLSDTGRYKQVLVSFKDNVNAHFAYVKAGLAVYFLLCLLRRQWPGKDVYMLLCCTFVYMMVYVATSQNLEWHLNTSADRLLHQLMPTFIFVVAEYVAGKGSGWAFNTPKIKVF